MDGVHVWYTWCMATTRTNKPAPIETLAPLQRIERRLISNVTSAVTDIEYWQSEVKRLDAITTFDHSERAAKLSVKVLRLQEGLALAIEELTEFHNVTGL